MKKIKWNIALFVSWVIATLMIVDVSLKGISKADAETNLFSVGVLLFWILVSIATNCFTFNHKDNEKKD